MRIKGKKGFPLSQQTKDKIGIANKGVWIKFNCDYCEKENEEKESHYKKKKRHFCNMLCYSSFRREKLPLDAKHKGASREDIKTESIQAIAMGFRFLKNLREAEFATDKPIHSEMVQNIIDSKIETNDA